MLYLSELDVRYSYIKQIWMFFVLFYTYRNSMFVIPIQNISDVLFYVYLSEFGFRYSYFTHI